MGQAAGKVSGFEAFNSPEFQAFCQRFGIPNMLTIDMTLEFPVDGPLRVTQRYLLEDRDDKRDTTTFDNKKFKTCSPPVDVASRGHG